VAVFGGDLRLMYAREKRDEPNQTAGLYFFHGLDYLIGLAADPRKPSSMWKRRT